MTRPPVSVEGATHSTEGGHQWAFASGLWRCSSCLRLTLEAQLTPQLVAQPCPGPKTICSNRFNDCERAHHRAHRRGCTSRLLCEMRCVHRQTRLWFGGGLQGQTFPSRSPSPRPYQARATTMAKAGGTQGTLPSPHRGLVINTERLRRAGADCKVWQEAHLRQSWTGGHNDHK
jgi:hypothetical protein